MTHDTTIKNIFNESIKNYARILALTLGDNLI